ncbi:hypothetical protein UPYG_G00167090 [Umbra pygmaea]|uniref:Protein hinderin n=1 Tax=Umbra pygmaea TaxID=75934 RepID=A0ABD0WMS8_UMBPY
MAAPSTEKNSGFVWINDTSDEELPIVFIPGVSRDRSLRKAYKSGSCSRTEPKLKMRAKCGSEIQAEARVTRGSKKRAQPCSLSSLSDSSMARGQLQSTHGATMLSPRPATEHLLSTPQANFKVTPAKSKASLKDLCPEDKRRIANLIQELARVSEEKEESVQRLRDEQETFERKILQLEEQNQLIVQERESLQHQYRECQELLGLYQQYLSQQQEKLNQSIAQLSHTHGKAPCSGGGPIKPSRCEGTTAWDGSYLGLPSAAGIRRNGGGREGGARGRNLSLSPASLSDNLHLATPPPYSTSSNRSRGPVKCLSCRGGPAHQPRPSDQRCGRVNGESTPRNTEDTASPRPHQDPVEPPVDSRGRPGPHAFPPGGTPADEGAKGALTVPYLGREDWEQRRHRLLLHKMQLEGERERLQARLAQQEKRLIRQNQQLRNTRLDYTRFQQATAAELGQSVTRNRTDSLPNGHAPLSEMRGCDDAWGCSEAAEQGPPHEDTPAHLPLQNSIHSAVHKESRRDMATSPMVSQSIVNPTTPPGLPRTPHAGLDQSLIELLDVFSPISVPERNRATAQRGHPPQHQPPLLTPKPARQVLLSPQGRYSAPKLDLEESQILEDIFFIC